jgi:hypothetical protein
MQFAAMDGMHRSFASLRMAKPNLTTEAQTHAEEDQIEDRSAPGGEGRDGGET